MISRCRQPRCAFSLVELMVVVFCTIALTGAAVALLHHLGRWGSSVQQASTHAAAVDRLELALRRELRHSTDIQPTGATLTIATRQGTSKWQLAKDACQVKWTVAGESPRHDRYDIGPRTDWQVNVQQGMAEVVLGVPEGERGLPVRVIEPLEDTELENEGGNDE